MVIANLLRLQILIRIVDNILILSVYGLNNCLIVAINSGALNGLAM